MPTRKTVLITGGNSGIGFATATQIAAQGGQVVLACRNTVKAAEAKQKILTQIPSAHVQIYSLDLASLSSIRKFAETFLSKHASLDVLINNAGVTPIKQQFTEEGFELQFGVNYLGHVLLTHLLLPALKAAPEARIIHLSSMLQSVSLIDFDSFRGRKPYFVLAACAQSKLGNLLFSNELARRLPKTITSNAVNPGAVQSDIWRDVPRPIYKVLKLILITPDRAAKLITKIALSAEWKGKSGEFKSAHGPLPFSRSCRNAELSCQLYQESCKLLNVTPI